MISIRRLFTVFAAVAAFSCVFVTDASATRTPQQVLDLSGGVRIQLQQFADDGATEAQAAALDALITELETEQKTFKKSLVKFSKAVKKHDGTVAGSEPYETQIEVLINLFDITVGTCGLQANQAILNGKGSLIGKAKKAGKFANKGTKAANFARDTTKPRWKRIKKLAGFVGAATKIVNKANKNK